MIREHKVSLWLGSFESVAEFNAFINVAYDENGNQIPSKFQETFEIKKYDMDAIETDWIDERVDNVEELLEGFSADEEIIPAFKEMLKDRDIKMYNSIILLYRYEYDGEKTHESNMDFIGVVDGY